MFEKKRIIVGWTDALYSEPEWSSNGAAEREIHVNGSGHLFFCSNENILEKGASRDGGRTSSLYAERYVSEFIVVGDRELGNVVVLISSECSHGDGKLKNELLGDKTGTGGVRDRRKKKTWDGPTDWQTHGWTDERDRPFYRDVRTRLKLMKRERESVCVCVCVCVYMHSNL